MKKMQMNVVITGVTGGVGQELLKQLLAMDAGRMYCVIRPKGGKTAFQRLAELTRNKNVFAINGDITAPGLGVDLSKLPRRIDKIIHCAADVRFEERYAVDITEANVDGTRNVIAFANLLHAPELHYVGTAYIAGDASLLGEQPVGDRVVIGNPRNTYEATKMQAENLVRSWAGGRVSIYRPSIVVGRSTDGVTQAPDLGYYGFLKGLHRLAERIRSEGKKSSFFVETNGTVHLPVAVQGVDSTPLNLIQGDWLAATIAKLVMLPARGEAYNLVHPSPMTYGEALRASLRILRIVNVTIRTPLSEGGKPNLVQRKITAGIAPFAPYISHSPGFVSRNAERDMGEDYVPPPPVTPEFLLKTLQYAKGLWDNAQTEQGQVIHLTQAREYTP